MIIASAASAQCDYSITIIEGPVCPPGGPSLASGQGLNDLGQVVGYYWRCLEYGDAPFVWTPEGGFVTLPQPEDSAAARALDINNEGVIAGFISRNNRRKPALWRNGELIELPLLDGHNFGETRAINDAGIAVGFSMNNITGDPPIAAVIWEDGEITALDLPFGPNARAFDISNAGHIVGWMGQASYIDSRAFLWRDGEVLDLGPIPGGWSARAPSVNRLGEVISWGDALESPDGWSATPAVVSRSGLWRNGSWTDLGVLPGLNENRAYSINDAGQIVGNVRRDAVDSRAYVRIAGTLRMLDDLVPQVGSEVPDGPRFGTAQDVNNAGQILTVGSTLLTPMQRPDGDVNSDCRVDERDLMRLLELWGAGAYSPADFTDDNVVDVVDLLVLLANWGVGDMP